MPVEYVRKGHLAIITLNRPHKLNAIDSAMQEALRVAWQRYEADDDAWLALLTGEGRAFCAGADKAWFEEARRGGDSLGLFLAGIARDPFWSGSLEKPTVVAVNGMAIGAGFDMVLRADLRIASDKAVFRLPEVDRGNVVILWDNLPYAIAAEIASGAEIPATRAHQVGLLNRLAPAAGLMDAALAWADELLAKPPLVLREALRTVRTIKNMNAAPNQQALRELTTAISKALIDTEDWHAAVAALLEKKQPQFKGR